MPTCINRMDDANDTRYIACFLDFEYSGIPTNLSVTDQSIGEGGIIEAWHVIL